MSHETIYRSLFVQARGLLREELAACLRTGRTVVVRVALRGIASTGDNSSYFARRWASEHVHFNSSGFREREFEFTKPRGSYHLISCFHAD